MPSPAIPQWMAGYVCLTLRTGTYYTRKKKSGRWFRASFFMGGAKYKMEDKRAIQDGNEYYILIKI